MTAEELVAFLWRGAAFALLIAAVAGATTFLVTRQQPPVYRATAAVLASQPGSSYRATNLVAPPPVDAGVYQGALLDGPVVADAMTALNGRAPTTRQLTALKERMRVSVDKQDLSSILRITVDAGDPKVAAATANAIADSLIDWDRNRAEATLARSIAAVERSVRAIDAQLAAGGGGASVEALQALRRQRLSELEAARATRESAVFVGLLEPLARAQAPIEAAGPRVVFRTFVAVVLGLLGGYGLLFLRRSTDPRVRGRDDLMALTGVPLLAEFPRRGRRSPRLSGEIAHFLRTNLLLATQGASPSVVVVTSPHSAREKAGVALSLAESFARAGYRTLLIDADLRRRGSLKGLPAASIRSTPLEVRLDHPHEPIPPARVVVDGKRSFDVVPSFAATMHPVELLSHGFGTLLEGWRDAYQVILVDAPPVLPFADTLTLAPWSTGVVLCASLAESTRRHLEDGLGLLRHSQVRVLGTVLTDAPRARRGTGVAGTGYEGSALEGQGAAPYRGFAPEPRTASGGAAPLKAERPR